MMTRQRINIGNRGSGATCTVASLHLPAIQQLKSSDMSVGELGVNRRLHDGGGRESAESLNDCEQMHPHLFYTCICDACTCHTKPFGVQKLRAINFCTRSK